MLKLFKHKSVKEIYMNKIINPKLLVSNTTPHREIKLRFVTGTKYGSGISYPYSGVRLMLIDNAGKSSLHYINRYDEKNNITRFETSSLDEVQVSIPLLVQISDIWIAPEDGSWYLDELFLEDLGNIDRLQCKKIIGNDTDQAVILSKDENVLTDNPFDDIKYEEGIKAYNDMKSELLKWNVGFMLIGIIITVIYRVPIEQMEAFIFGSMVGLIYLYMLEKQIDTLGSPNNLLLIPLVSSPIRLSLITYMSYIYISTNDTSFIPYIIGFFMYKLSIISYSVKSVLHS